MNTTITYPPGTSVDGGRLERGRAVFTDSPTCDHHRDGSSSPPPPPDAPSRRRRGGGDGRPSRLELAARALARSAHYLMLAALLLVLIEEHRRQR